MKIKDPVRAKHPNGAEFTTSRAFAKSRKLQIIDKPAVDRNGDALPPKNAPLNNNSEKPTGNAPAGGDPKKGENK